MEAIIVEEGIVTNRILVQSIVLAESLFPDATVVEDEARVYAKGDTYPA